MSSIAEKDEELGTLRTCLMQVTEQAAAVDAGASPGEGEVEGLEEGGVSSGKKQPQLEKIQAMLNTTKVVCVCVSVSVCTCMCVCVCVCVCVCAGYFNRG